MELVTKQMHVLWAWTDILVRRNMAQNRDTWWARVNAEMILRVS